MKEFVFRDDTVQIPEYVDELTPQQYTKLLSLAALMSDDDAALWAQETFTAALLGIHFPPRLLREKYSGQFSEVQKHVAAAFFKKNDEGATLPNVNTLKNMLPEYGGYKGPGDMLAGLPFGKFTECVAVLGDKPGIDEYCHTARLLYNIPEDKPVDDILAVHAVTFFANVWHAVQTQKICINGAEIDFSIIFKPAPGQSKPDDGTGLAGIAFELATTGVFGNIRELDDTDMWQVLLYLYKIKFEYLHTQKEEKK